MQEQCPRCGAELRIVKQIRFQAGATKIVLQCLGPTQHFVIREEARD